MAMRFTIGDLYEKKYMGEMVTRRQWEEKRSRKKQQKEQADRTVSSLKVARAGR